MARTKTPEQAEKILSAAAHLFATHSFHKARMEDIANAAGVGKGTLYRYFKDKEELYLALLDWAAAGFRQHLDDRLTPAVGPHARLEAMVGGILEFFAANPYVFDLLQHAESRQDSGTLANWQKVRQGNIQLLTDILEEGREAGLWCIPDPETPILMMLGGLRAVIRLGSSPNPANQTQRIVEDFLHGANRKPEADGACRESSRHEQETASKG